jgi:hypothetical protein
MVTATDADGTGAARADRGVTPMSELYDQDIVLRSERQAELLRRGAQGERDGDLDWFNLAEEIAAVGRSERRELRHRMARLLQHLLKWHYQPEHRSRGWRSTIQTRRREINAVLDDNPSLRQTLPAVIEAAYPAARAAALEETGLLALPETSPFDVRQALDGELPAS